MIQKKKHKKKKEYTSETGAPFSSIVPSTVQDTKQQMISESLSVSAKKLKSGVSEVNASSDNLGETKNECSEYSNISDIQNINTADTVINQTSSTHHRRNCAARRNPDFLWM